MICPKMSTSPVFFFLLLACSIISTIPNPTIVEAISPRRSNLNSRAWLSSGIQVGWRNTVARRLSANSRRSNAVDLTKATASVSSRRSLYDVDLDDEENEDYYMSDYYNNMNDDDVEEEQEWTIAEEDWSIEEEERAMLLEGRSMRGSMTTNPHRSNNIYSATTCSSTFQIEDADGDGSIVDDLIGLALDTISPGSISYGFAAGFCSGVALKKVGQMAACVLGVGFISMQVLAEQGYIEVNHSKIQQKVESWLDFNKDGQLGYEDRSAATKKIMDVLQYNLPSAGGFAVGITSGLKYG